MPDIHANFVSQILPTSALSTNVINRFKAISNSEISSKTDLFRNKFKNNSLQLELQRIKDVIT